jgi:hypothetical protein
VSKDIVVEANNIMHKLIRHYSRKQRRALVVSESLGASSTPRGNLLGSNSYQAAAPTLTQLAAISDSSNNKHINNSDEVSQSSNDSPGKDGPSPGSSSGVSSSSSARIASEIPKDNRKPRTTQPAKPSANRGRGPPRKTSGPRMV